VARAAKICAAVCMLIGFAALLAWWLGVRILESRYPQLATMKAVTAACFLICGASLWFIGRKRRLADALAGLALLVAAAALLQHRMSGATGAGFMMAACALLLSSREAGKRLWQTLCIALVAMAWLTLVGYAFGLHTLYKTAGFSSVAFQTGLAFFILALGILLTRSEREPVRTMLLEDESGIVTRRLVLSAALLLPSMGWLESRGLEYELYTPAMGGAVYATLATLMLLSLLWRTVAALNRVSVQRHLLEQERTRLLAEAQAAVLMRDEFIAIASHELRTPLTPLLLRLSQLKRDARAASAGEREIGNLLVAENQVKRLADLVGDLLDVSRLGTVTLPLQLEVLDLSAVAGEVVTRFEPAAAKAKCELTLQATAAVGNWDRFRLEQALTRLVSNAIKYGAGKPVVIGVERVGDFARVSVRDEGIGIAPGALARIFEKYERAVSDRHYGGLGLGLYVTRQAIEAMRGTVRAESSPGAGSTFIIELPI
jgi:signal transduction histidine kinase